MTLKKLKIGDICLTTDYVANGSFASLKENVKYLDNDGYAILVRLTDFTKQWKKSFRYVSKHAYEFLKHSKLYPGDLIISSVGEPGKTFLVPDLGKPMTLGPNSVLIRPDNKILSTQYLKHFLDSDLGQKLINSIVSGTTQRKFNKTSLRNLEITIPTLEEQQNIGAKLDAAFIEIDKTINFIKKKEQEINTLNEAVLSDEFTLSSGSKKLSEVCKIYNGGTPDTKNKIYWEGNKQWLTPRDMGKMTYEYVTATLRQLTEEGLKNSSANLIPKNSIILSCRAPIGHLAINKVPMAFNQGCKGLVPDNNILLHKYLYYFLLYSKKLLNNLGTGTTFKEISNKVLSKVKIRVPSLDIQKKIIYKFDLITGDLKKLKDINRKQIENYSKLKKALIIEELRSKAA
jgi:type I restriction enzyme, S subunit